MLGQKVKKEVVLVNRSTLDVSFTLLLNTNTTLDSRVGNTHTHTLILSSTWTILNILLFLYLFLFILLILHLQDLSFTPAGELSLKANGGSCTVEIQFLPRQHIAPFSAELQAEFAGLLHPLVTIQGCCQVHCKLSFTFLFLQSLISFSF